MTNKLIEEKLQQFDNKFYLFQDEKTLPQEGKLSLFAQTKDYERAKLFLKTSLNEVVEAREREIHQDLMKIADQGEYEELRREVERYFKEIINKKKETK